MVKIRSLVPQKFVNCAKHLPLAIFAVAFYRLPARKIRVIGVTGTDGKTTTVSLIYHILRTAGFPVAMISSVCAKISEEEIDTGFHVTSPDSWLLQKLLRKIVNRRIKFVVLEVTSHALDQFRTFGINFEVAVLTNITHEHLDYHGTFENYLNTKARLFNSAKTSVLNRDDESYKKLESIIKKRGKKIITYGMTNKVDFSPESFPFKTSLPGEYNKYNCLAAIAACSILGVLPETIKKATASFDGVAGRMEEIREGQDFRVIVDFAHTPNALGQVLKNLSREKKKGSKLIVVFGAAGLRDQTKRQLMGEIAGKYADFSILTAEDPRTEKVEEICRQIAEGCKISKSKYKIILDREEAINYAIIKLAKKDDIVVMCGKGHEKSMCFGKKEYPWSDKEKVKKALASRGYRGEERSPG